MIKVLHFHCWIILFSGYFSFVSVLISWWTNLSTLSTTLFCMQRVLRWTKGLNRVLDLYVHGRVGGKTSETNIWYEQELEWEELLLTKANCLFCTYWGLLCAKDIARWSKIPTIKKLTPGWEIVNIHTGQEMMSEMGKWTGILQLYELFRNDLSGLVNGSAGKGTCSTRLAT